MVNHVTVSLSQEDLKILLLQMNHVSLGLIERVVLTELKKYFIKTLHESKSVFEIDTCTHPCWVPIGTQRIKICVDCGTEIPWNLDKDQSSKLGDTSEKAQRDFKQK